MPLKLVRRKGSEHWYLRGTVRKQTVFESTGTNDKKAAEAIRIKREARLLHDSIYGREANLTFFEGAVSYMAAGGSPRHLGNEVDGKWTGLLGHFETKILLKITQENLDAAAEKLYPNTQPETKNRQCYTPFIAVWNHALPESPRKWKRPKKPKGTNIVRARRLRAGTRPVGYERACEFVLSMSPAPAMVMSALFYTGMRPIELFVLSAEMVDLPARWITLENSKIGEPRGIPIHEFLVPLLRPLIERGGLLFRSSLGTPYPVGEGISGQMKTAIRNARRRSGIGGISPYTARHTVSTQLVVAGVHPHIKDQILGHAIDDMSRHYTHVPQAPLIEAINTLPIVGPWAKAPWMTDPVGQARKFVNSMGRRSDLMSSAK
ncbi:site-specific integrase [Bradyrhizobium sp. 62]|uniref:site-specific integrase n=1 Tax=Bradyrhizobium sp. 62 TaxID=1043588 RepID=UPI001FF740A2|nr:site-specific integrase [Bradyrhizobium sp. 62]MCK1367231.1 site-specific integrase [Bradyrhizobium sp. 62]